MPEDWKTIRPRVKRRQQEFIQAHGPCEHCGAKESLRVFWRDLKVRHLPQMLEVWNRSDETRAAWAKDLIVLCYMCMRIHLSGVGHGGGVAGIRGCNCIPCKERRREYFRLRKAANRAKGRGHGQQLEHDAEGPQEQNAGPQGQA